MTLPSRIQQILDEWKIAYTVSPPSNSITTAAKRSPEMTQSTILEDKAGRVHVIHPANRILDLNKVQAQTKRTLVPIKKEALEKVRQSLNVSELPALPQLTELESLVDEVLLEQDAIAMMLNPDQTLHIAKDDFQTLVSSARIASYSVAIPTIAIPGAHWQDTDEPKIHSAITHFTQLRVSQRLEETLDIPPMPETAQKIIDLRVDPDAQTEMLANLVGKDPGLSAQVVSWANSPYYGLSGSITNIEEAIVRVLGFELVINLALGLSLGRTLSVPKDGPQGYIPFWQQSVYSATLMAELCRAMPPHKRPTQGISYLCGLLHNFGCLVLGHVFPPHFNMISRHIDANPNINRYFIEQHLMGITREQISSSLLSQWNLPEEVCTAIRYQNEPNYEGEHHVLSSLLYISARLLRQHQINDAPLEPIPDGLIARLELDMTKAEAALEKVMAAKDDLQEMARQLTQS